MQIKKPRYRKKAIGINSHHRQSYEPEILNDGKDSPTLKGLVDALYPSIPNACGFKYVDIHTTPNYQPEDDINVQSTAEVETSTRVPKSIPEIISEVDSESELQDILCSFSVDEAHALESGTTGQNDNQEWKSQRVGRITASVSHSVMTKVNTLKKSNDMTNDACKSLLDSICSLKSDSKAVPALLYGTQMEDEARKAYTQEINLKHKSVQVKQNGLFIKQDKAYTAASPDGLVDCTCCGEGLLEIKCPFSIANSPPNQSNLPYLKANKQGQVNLSKSHQYYSQVQHQMGVTRRKWCDFFVYSKHGHYLERIKFDLERWRALKSAAEYFFRKHITPYLLNNKDRVT